MSDGGSAFPKVLRAESCRDYCNSDVTNTHIESSDGMSLRDYFAAQAIAPILGVLVDGSGEGYAYSDVAEDAYRMADAMLKARERTS